MSLQEYSKKRAFSKTPEPRGAGGEGGGVPLFVVQEHHSSHHHFDFRLEHEGVLASWAVPKGVPESPGEKRLAVRTEDHPLAYADFEGSIPEGEYGAGEVKIWDRGTFVLNTWEADRIEVILQGNRLNGRYLLVRFKRAGENDWLLFRAKE
ncbi:MAG TPA: ATP-dependent DNA ligase [Methanolinea sp.]|nr:ATP-dependent DNA ligase [Methanolinea sp.]